MFKKTKSGAGSSPKHISKVPIGKPTVIRPDARSASSSLDKEEKEKKDEREKEMADEDCHPRPTSAQSQTSQKDLMISYSHADKEMMLKLRDNLEKYGISVWVDVSGLSAGVDFLSKIGEAIIDCKLFISLLSASTVKSKYCQDELALAYVSNRAIFPVALEEPAELYPLMDTGMKLQLASYEWVILGRDPQNFDEQFQKLLKLLKKELLRQDNETGKANQKQTPETVQKEKPPLVKQHSRYQLNKKNRKSEDKVIEPIELVEPEEYWKDHFGIKEEVPYEEFVKCVRRDFQKQLEKMFKEEEIDWLISILRREMEVEEGVLYKYALLAFCNVEDEYQPLWQRIRDQARESWSMKDVFDMNSTVRVDAIENLGKFRSAAVIDALRDLLSDEDANARAVAAVSLARTNANDPVTVKFLMKTLNDKDRLVREAGCLALGHLRVKQAVSKILHMWRNDVISHVREAANVALNQIGGPEVEKAMRVTKVLADEIRQLTSS